MTEQHHHTTVQDFCNLLVSDSADNPLAQIYTILLNNLLIMQQDAHLGRAAYQRTSSNTGQRNGFKSRTISTKVGNITLDIPQVRNSSQPFKPFIPGFEQGCRIDRAFIVWECTYRKEKGG